MVSPTVTSLAADLAALTKRVTALETAVAAVLASLNTHQKDDRHHVISPGGSTG